MGNWGRKPGDQLIYGSIKYPTPFDCYVFPPSINFRIVVTLSVIVVSTFVQVVVPSVTAVTPQYNHCFLQVVRFSSIEFCVTFYQCNLYPY